MQYLDEWEREVAKEKDMEDKEKSRMMLSRETREGLRITGKNNEPAVLIIMVWHCHSFVILRAGPKDPGNRGGQVSP